MSTYIPRPLCPDCKKPAKTETSNSEKNPGRDYYVCPSCKGRDGKGKKWLAWCDGAGNFEQKENGAPYKKRKAEGSPEKADSAYNNAIVNDILFQLKEQNQKIYEIHERLKKLSPPNPGKGPAWLPPSPDFSISTQEFE